MVSSIVKALGNMAQPSLRSATLSNVFSYGSNFFTDSATPVTDSAALKIAAFYDGVRIISNAIAVLPKAIYKKDKEGRVKNTDHPAYTIIAKEPNSYQTSFAFHRVMTYSLVIKGDAFALIERNKATGNVLAMHYLPYEDVQVYKQQNKVYYKYKGQVYSSHDIFHVANISGNGIVGKSVVYHAAQSLGVTLDAQNFASTVYKDKGLGYGVIESDKSVDPTPKKAIIDAFNNRMSGAGNFKTAMLDEGFKYKSITLSPTESKFLETGASSVLEVCRWLGIYPHKLKHLDNANFSNVYQMEIAHVQDTIMPYVVLFEQEYNKKIFNDVEKVTGYVKFNEKSLLRASLNDKADYYAKLIFAKVFTPNEVRELEDMNPKKGGDDLLQPVNLQNEKQIEKILTDE